MVVKIEERRIEYYDHLYRNSVDGTIYLAAMKMWLYDEVQKKTGEILDMTRWICEDMSSRIPVEARQRDNHSCGPYAVVSLELIDSNLLFEQKRWYNEVQMQVHYRHRVMVQIHQGRIGY
jgi:hypothetical protein